MNTPHQKLRIIVGGMVGQFPLGGVAWDYFHYCLGLHELGHEVYYHEDTWVWPYDPIKGHPTDDPDYTVRFIREFFDTYAPHLSNNWHYLLLHDKSFGMSRQRFDEICRTADLFINVSGACFFPDQLHPRCLRVFMDTDPGYNQIVMATKPAWSEHVDRWVQQVRDHDRHLTYAENIYSPDCLIPRLGLDWQITRPIATLGSWQSIRQTPPPEDAAFTTVMSWNYFRGKLEYGGREFGAKAPEYDKFHDLPNRVTGIPMTLAVGGYQQPAEQIRADGWNWIEARELTRTADNYMRFIERSLGEWSIAKNVYVDTVSGWFSCRTACYLAAGRPAVVQETGWSRYVPSGQGVIAFATMPEAIDGLRQIHGNWKSHSHAAYEVAREYLAPDKVLPPMIEAIYSNPRNDPAAPGPVPPNKSSRSIAQ